eukprot:scaffold27433_cov107-Isochrysis_galbana.AAC.2
MAAQAQAQQMRSRFVRRMSQIHLACCVLSAGLLSDVGAKHTEITSPKLAVVCSTYYPQRSTKPH